MLDDWPDLEDTQIDRVRRFAICSIVRLAEGETGLSRDHFGGRDAIQVHGDTWYQHRIWADAFSLYKGG